MYFGYVLDLKGAPWPCKVGAEHMPQHAAKLLQVRLLTEDERRLPLTTLALRHPYEPPPEAA